MPIISVPRKIGLIVLVVMLSVLAVYPARGQANGSVINTNFPKPGDTQASPAYRLTPPNYGDYSNMETDPIAISADERDSVIANLQSDLSGVAVASLNSWQEVKEGNPAIQVVNNVPIQGATYTIILPPNWNKKGKVPVILSGNGAAMSNNQRLWKDADTGLVNLVARSSGQGRTGLIAAMSNAGGTESLGVDDHTYKSVGAFMDFIAQNGGDPQRLITLGGSRGGNTALMWAINPLKLNYNAIAVFADIPPISYGFASQRSVLTYPALAKVYQLVTHDTSAYQYSNPNGPGKAQPPFLSAIVGTNDPAQADAKGAAALADGLKGKVVVIGRGTHDPYLALREFVAFDQRLTVLGITHTTVITLGQGHRVSTFWLDQIGLYFDALSKGQSYQPPPGRFVYINIAPPDGPQVPLAGFLKGDQKASPVASPELPFTVEFPAKAGVGLPVDVSLCGAPNGAYSYVAKDASGKAWTKGDGKFDASECDHAEIKAPDAPGEYTWTFTYNSKEIPATYTPERNEGGCGLPAITEVTQQQPAPDELLTEPTLGFGVDEYSAQDQGCS